MTRQSVSGLAIRSCVHLRIIARSDAKPDSTFADRAIAHFSNSSSRVHRLWTRLSKNRTNFLRIGSCLHGSDAEIRVPPVPVAGNDAAADAGDQAAAAVESRPLGLCRRGTGAKSAARARQ